ncbi:MAG: protein kinase [Gemmatimonadota bacterium]
MSDPVTRLNAALDGRYRVEREIGEGGMATVYLADDLKHERKVALKVLKPDLAAVVGADRFLAEIKTTANLQHPHILALYDSGQADGFLYYVMPYVEGETLADRLEREKQLPIDEAVRIATTIANALQHAHERGVIHRDIKPANILIQGGEPIVADFGIALAVGAAGGNRLTETGLSVGTPYYMSPEQATGDQQVGPASDTYSLGAVLYEMLTGDPPYLGSTAQAILGQIIAGKAVAPTEKRQSIPANVDAAIRKSLEKLPADRFTGADDFARALADPAFVHGDAAVVAAAASNGFWKPLALAMSVISILLVGNLIRSRGAAESSAGSYDVGLPAESPMSFGPRRDFAVSPTGEFLVYLSVTDSISRLWVRDLRGGESRPIRGSEGALLAPLLSPDGTRVAFTTSDQEVRVMPVGGGESRLIAKLSNGHARAWLANDEILLEEREGQLLRWIDPEGREIRSETASYCINPNRVGDDGQLLCGGGGSKYAQIIDPGDAASGRFLRDRSGERGGGQGGRLRGSDFRLIDESYLVYVSVEGDVMATSIDLSTFTVGRSVRLVSDVRFESYSGAGEFDVTPDGTLVYASGPPGNTGQLVEAARDGTIRALPVPPAAFLRWDVSPDGRRLAAVQEGLEWQELHIYNLDTGQGTQWIEGARVGHPRWSPDGSRILVSVTADPESPVASLLLGSPTSPSPPDTIGAIAAEIGSFFADSLVLAHSSREARIGIRLDLRTDPVTVDTISQDMWAPSLSPDGRWVAYGVPNGLILEPWPARDERYVVSDAYGLGDAQWVSNTEFAAWSFGDTWQRFEVRPGQDPPVSQPRFWFRDARLSDTPGASHAATPDGGVVYMRGPDQEVAHYLRVVLNWVEQMKRAVDEANRD